MGELGGCLHKCLWQACKVMHQNLLVISNSARVWLLMSHCLANCFPCLFPSQQFTEEMDGDRHVSSTIPDSCDSSSGNSRCHYSYHYLLTIVIIISHHSWILMTITLESPNAQCHYGYHYTLNSDHNPNHDGLVSWPFVLISFILISLPKGLWR